MAADGRSYWPIWIAWSICGLALIQAGVSWLVPVPGRWFALLITLVPLIALVMALGVILVAGWRDRAGGTRWGWLLLAPALGIQIWATVLGGIPRADLPLNAAWLGVVAITVAGIASVVGPARLWADQTITVGSTFQRLLEIGIIGLVIGMLIGSRPDVTRSAWPIDSSLLFHLIITGIRMSAIGVLLVTGRNLAGFLTSALLCGILSHGYAGTDGR